VFSRSLEKGGLITAHSYFGTILEPAPFQAMGSCCLEFIGDSGICREKRPSIQEWGCAWIVSKTETLLDIDEAAEAFEDEVFAVGAAFAAAFGVALLHAGHERLALHAFRNAVACEVRQRGRSSR